MALIGTSVRISSLLLGKLQIEHVATTLTSSAAAGAAMGGDTNWGGRWRRRRVAVGWEWGLVGGVLVILRPVNIRTNLLLLSVDGRPQPALLSRVYLLEWIETLPWRDTVRLHALN